MPLDFVLIIGLIASIISTIAYVPQVVHTMKLKHMKGISLMWLVLIVLGSAFYVIYGFLIGSIPIALSSIAIGFMALILVYHKEKYK